MMNIQDVQGNIQFIAQGLERFRIKQFLSDKPPFVVRVEYFEKIKENEEELKAYAIAIINAIKQLLSLNPLYSEELKQYLGMFSPDQPSPLTDFAAGITTASGEDLQEVLELSSVIARMKKVMMLLQKEIEIAKLQSKIQKDVNIKVDDNKRKFFLREQLKAIQKELGLQKDDKTSDVDKFKEKFAKLKPPEHVTKRFDEEVEKLSVLETGSSEYGVTRNYLDWVTSFPWGVYSKDNIDIKRAEKVLERDHAGLSDVKERIIEFFAAGIYKKDIAGSIILFVGPPGVGKTSIGKSIAEALGRKFYRFSLGGMRDEAEIKGHRRTYVGALPGKMVQALKDTQVANPVIMLDEVDKIGTSYQGDPASALLEVLDPEQNFSFSDNYLDVAFDLSDVIFLTTANVLHTIPAPLRDRMEVLELSGYTEVDKLKIATRYLIPRQREANGLKSSQIKFTPGAIKKIITGYTRESGLRNLERQIGAVCRGVASKIAEGEADYLVIRQKDLHSILGPASNMPDMALRIKSPGVVIGLAWTPYGGEILFIEAVAMKGRQGLTLTGQLGDVMKESATTALSFIRANAKKNKIDESFFSDHALHIHVPEGSIPKDGPSAGVAMLTCLVSLMTGRRVKKRLAMSGEITLRGEVLPVGGIKEKVIAAHRTGIREIILPLWNKKDMEDIPDYIKDSIEFHFIDKMKNVLELALE